MFIEKVSSKIELKRTELCCIESLINSARYDIQCLRDQLAEYRIKLDETAIEQFEFDDIANGIYQSINCYHKLIQLLEDSI